MLGDGGRMEKIKERGLDERDCPSGNADANHTGMPSPDKTVKMEIEISNIPKTEESPDPRMMEESPDPRMMEESRDPRMMEIEILNKPKLEDIEGSRCEPMCQELHNSMFETQEHSQNHSRVETVDPGSRSSIQAMDSTDQQERKVAEQCTMDEICESVGIHSNREPRVLMHQPLTSTDLSGTMTDMGTDTDDSSKSVVDIGVTIKEEDSSLHHSQSRLRRGGDLYDLLYKTKENNAILPGCNTGIVGASPKVVYYDYDEEQELYRAAEKDIKIPIDGDEDSDTLTENGYPLERSICSNNMCEGTHQCDICEKCFTTGAGLQKHIHAVHIKTARIALTRYTECHICGETVVVEMYIAHISSHNQSKKSSLDQIVKNRNELQNGTRHQCALCDASFSKVKRLQRHIHKIHKRDSAYKCAICDKLYSSTLIKLQQHVKESQHQDNLAFQCAICDQLFSRGKELEKHMRCHREGAEFKCEKCDDSFARVDYLKLHTKMVHLGLSHRRCMVCGKIIILDRFNDHILSHGPAVDPAPVVDTGPVVDPGPVDDPISAINTSDDQLQKPIHHQCALCDESFSKVKRLQRHIHKVHKRDSAYKCAICDKLYSSTLIKLQQHVNESRHKDDLAFQCAICDQLFSRGKELEKHMRCHREGAEFKCEKCDNSFARVDYLKLHTKMVHLGLSHRRCIVCGKAISLDRFNDHILSHVPVVDPISTIIDSDDQPPKPDSNTLACMSPKRYGSIKKIIIKRTTVLDSAICSSDEEPSSPVLIRIAPVSPNRSGIISSSDDKAPILDAITTSPISSKRYASINEMTRLETVVDLTICSLDKESLNPDSIAISPVSPNRCGSINEITRPDTVVNSTISSSDEEPLNPDSNRCRSINETVVNSTISLSDEEPLNPDSNRCGSINETVVESTISSSDEEPLNPDSNRCGSINETVVESTISSSDEEPLNPDSNRCGSIHETVVESTISVSDDEPPILDSNTTAIISPDRYESIMHDLMIQKIYNTKMRKLNTNAFPCKFCQHIFATHHNRLRHMEATCAKRKNKYLNNKYPLVESTVAMDTSTNELSSPSTAHDDGHIETPHGISDDQLSAPSSTHSLICKLGGQLQNSSPSEEVFSMATSDQSKAQRTVRHNGMRPDKSPIGGPNHDTGKHTDGDTNINRKRTFSRSKCPVCDKWFTFLKSHMRSHAPCVNIPCVALNPEKPQNTNVTEYFKCTICSIYVNTRDYNSHIMYHKELFRCKSCDHIFPRADDLKRHMESWHTGCSYCITCGKNVNPDKYTNHIWSHNSKHRCDKCSKVFTGHHNLMQHQKMVHEGLIVFICGLCNEMHTCQSKLDAHFKSRHPEGKYQICTVCGQTLRGNALKKHILAHDEVVTVQCGLCAQLFSSVASINMHMQLSHANSTESDNSVHDQMNNIQEPKHQCATCGKSFCKVVQLQEHITIGHNRVGKQYKCAICDNVYFTTVQEAERHNNDMHSTDELVFQCSICDKLFSIAEELTRHVNQYHGKDKYFHCVKCEYLFSGQDYPSMEITPEGVAAGKCMVCGLTISITGFNEHILSHCPTVESITSSAADMPGDQLKTPCLLYDNLKRQSFEMHLEAKPIVFVSCAVCSMSVADQDLLIHMLAHSELSRCDVCDQIFPRASDLEEHMESEHRVSSMCYVCGVHIHKSDYNNHILSHKKRLRCCVCDKVFIGEDKLRLHRRKVHTKNTDFSCGICGDTYAMGNDLEKHFKMKHPGRGYSMCNVCGQTVGGNLMKKHRFFHDEVTVLQCGLCFQLFNTVARITMHMDLMHSKHSHYSCTVCGEKVIHQLYNRHMVSHSSAVDSDELQILNALYDASNAEIQEHQFQCAMCDISFSNIILLQKHIRIIHQENRGFKCALSVCSQFYFATIEDLGEHNTSLHQSTENAFQCVICNQLFSIANQLEAHVDNIHKIHVYFRCKECGHLFAEVCDLMHHMISQCGDGEVDHRCTLCGETVGFQGFNEHILSHSPVVDSSSIISTVVDPDSNTTAIISPDRYESIMHNSMIQKTYKNKMKHNGDVFQCEFCNKTFTRNRNMLRHMKLGCKMYGSLNRIRRREIVVYSRITESDDQPVNQDSTSIASISQKKNESKKKTFYRKTVVNRFKHEIIMKHFLNKAYKNAMKEHNVYQCEFCHLTFSAYPYYVKHIKTIACQSLMNTLLKNECLESVLQSKLSQRTVLMQILKKPTKNSIESENFKITRCTVCGVEVQCKQFSVHMLVHSGITHCGICDLLFPRACELERHREAQHCKASLCTTCGTHVKVKDILTHLLWHHDTRSCESCHKVITGAMNLNQHHRIVHNGENVFTCGECVDTYTSDTELNAHFETVHPQLKYCRCRVCGQTVRENALKKHMLFHDDEVVFQCGLCAQLLQSPASVVKHMKLWHLEDSRRKCTLCGDTVTLEMFSEHMLSHSSYVLSQSSSDEVNPLNRLFVDAKMRHQCETCHKLFADHNQLGVHLVDTHVKENVFGCDLCDKQYASRLGLELHVKKIHRGCLMCEVCGGAVKHDELENHLLSHNATNVTYKEITMNRCEMCDKYFVRRDFMEHMSLEHPEIKDHPCRICGDKVGMVDFEVHARMHFDKVPQHLYVCGDCGQKFRSDTTLECHRRKEHTKDDVEHVKCSMCWHVFKGDQKEKRLARHLRQHAEKNPVARLSPNDSSQHKCDVCGMILESSKLLVSHYKKCHSNKITYENHVCEQCGKKYIKRHLLIRHIAIAHNGYRFRCELCPKEFRSANALKTHIYIHTGEQPFACGKCDKRFNNESSAAMHKRTHTGVKPYRCEVCGLRFSQGYSLTRHMRTHTGHKPFECGECGSKFSQKGGLTSHISKHHREKSRSGR